MTLLSRAALATVTLFLSAASICPPPRPPRPPDPPKPVPTPVATLDVQVQSCTLGIGRPSVTFFGEAKTADERNHATFTRPAADMKGAHPITARQTNCALLESHVVLQGTDQSHVLTLDPLRATCGPLRVDGRRLVCPSGEVWRWQGVSAFALIEKLSEGDEAGAVAFLQWASRTGFNLVRVFTTLVHIADLPPDVGRRFLPRALELARDHGLYVEAVAVADSASRSYDWKAHARAVFEECSRHENCLAQFANEPDHPTQVGELHDMAAVDRFAREAAAGLPRLVWTAGPPPTDEELTPTGGSYATRHLDRGREPLNNIRRKREIAGVQDQVRLYTVSDEPMGIAERAAPQRWAEARYGMMMGALCGGFQIGCTLHLNDTIRADIPGPVQQSASADFLAGFAFTSPSTTDWTFRNACSFGAPIQEASFEDRHPTCQLAGSSSIVRAYAYTNGTTGVLFVLHRTPQLVDSDLKWGDGWQRTVIGQRDQFTAFAIRR